MSTLSSEPTTSVEDPFGGPGGGTIVTDEVCAWFGKNYVLDRVSLTMPTRKVTALIGPSGCGKSTFLRTLNRMHELIPSARMAGTVSLDGVDIYGPTIAPVETRLKIGMVFQKPNPFPTMSIAENVVSGLKLARIKRNDRDELVEKSLTRAGLWNEVKDRLKAAGGALSGGQQQRLCIARALAVEPEVLLMDEPCSALDPSSTMRIEETIREIVHQVTIVIVTHNMQQAARVSDQTAFFLGSGGTLAGGEPGRVIEFAPTAKIFTNPDNPRTEDYINGRFG
jgi:phosphate transport system ATP-binding protein